MSTGAGCYFLGEAANRWFVCVQDYPYGETESYGKDGPFVSLETAKAHLRRSYANPGGYSIRAQFECKHAKMPDWKPVEFRKGHEQRECPTCGHYESRDTVPRSVRLEEEAERMRKDLAIVEAKIKTEREFEKTKEA